MKNAEPHVAFSINTLAYDITLMQHGKDRFSVTYGAQVKTGLAYAEAAKELGECIMHALVCDGEVQTEA